MARKVSNKSSTDILVNIPGVVPLWQLEIREITGHNIESAGRAVVNELLKKGWVLLHIYTLVYHEDGIWRERPMAILGKPKKKKLV